MFYFYLLRGKKMCDSRISKDGRRQLVIDHLTETADYVFNVGKKFGFSYFCMLVGLIHDLGKFSDCFIEYLERSHAAELKGEKNCEKGSVIHAVQGAKYIFEKDKDNKSSLFWLLKEIAAMCLANHHGSLVDGLSPDGDAVLENKVSKDREELHFEEVLETAKREGFPFDKIDELLDKSQMELKEFINKCKAQKLNLMFMLHFLTKFIYSH